MFKRMMSISAIAGSAVILALGGAAPAMAADNLVVNGGFDAPGFDDNNGLNEVGSNHNGWDVLSVSPFAGPDPDGTAGLKIWFPGMSGDGATLAAPFPDGPFAGVTGAIEQTIPTVAGTTYSLEYETRISGGWDHPEAYGWAGGVTGGAMVNGETIDRFETEVGEFSTRTLVFTASGPTTTVGFYSNGGGVGIDNVSVIEVPANDSPLEAGAAIGGAGVAGIGAAALYLARRHRVETTE